MPFYRQAGFQLDWSHNLAQHVAAQSAGTAERGGCRVDMGTSCGLLLNAPCTVSGACGRDGDWPKCCEGLTPQGSVGTGHWCQQDRQEFMK